MAVCNSKGHMEVCHLHLHIPNHTRHVFEVVPGTHSTPESSARYLPTPSHLSIEPIADNRQTRFPRLAPSTAIRPTNRKRQVDPLPAQRRLIAQTGLSSIAGQSYPTYVHTCNLRPTHTVPTMARTRRHEIVQYRRGKREQVPGKERKKNETREKVTIKVFSLA
jgi:hypothetical protein